MVHPNDANVTRGTPPHDDVNSKKTTPRAKVSWADIVENSERENAECAIEKDNINDSSSEDIQNLKGRTRSVRLVIPNYEINEVVEMVKEKLANINEITQVETTSKNQVIFTFKTTVIRDTLMDQQLIYKGQQVLCSLLDSERKMVILREVPGELEDSEIIKVLNGYGRVQSFQSSTLKNYPMIRTTARRIIMSMTKKIPNYLKIKNFVIKVTYEGVIKVCKNCYLPEHTILTCPKVKCFQCNTYGHIRRNCPGRKKQEKEEEAEQKEGKQIGKKQQDTTEKEEEQKKKKRKVESNMQNIGRDQQKEKNREELQKETTEKEMEMNESLEEDMETEEEEETEGDEEEEEESEEEKSEEEEKETKKEKEKEKQSKEKKRNQENKEKCTNCLRIGHNVDECRLMTQTQDGFYVFRVKPEFIKEISEKDRIKEQRKELEEYRDFVMQQYQRTKQDFLFQVRKGKSGEYLLGKCKN